MLKLWLVPLFYYYRTLYIVLAIRALTKLNIWSDLLQLNQREWVCVYVRNAMTTDKDNEWFFVPSWLFIFPFFVRLMQLCYQLVSMESFSMSSTSLGMATSVWPFCTLFIFSGWFQLLKFGMEGMAAEISGNDGKPWPGGRRLGGTNAVVGAVVVNKLMNLGNNVLKLLNNWLMNCMKFWTKAKSLLTDWAVMASAWSNWGDGTAIETTNNWHSIICKIKIFPILIQSKDLIVLSFVRAIQT